MCGTARAGDAGAINAIDRLEKEETRYSAILDDSFTTWLEPVNVDPYLQFKENLNDATGFEYITFYTLMNHYGSHVPSESQNLNGQIHTINSWTPHHGYKDAGSLVFYYMNVSQYTDASAGQLTNDLGLTTGINDSAVRLDFFRFVAWYQPLMDGDIELYAGQFLLRDLFDFGNYASDDTRNFISEIMSSNPAATLPLPGLGFAATARLTDRWSIGGGFTDGNAKMGDLWNFNTFGKGDYAYMGYLKYSGCVAGIGEANYQLNLYSVDATQQAAYSRGLSLIMEQDIGQKHVLFYKYNRADKRRSSTKQSMAAAIMRKGFYIWEDDVLGFGGGWGDPTDPSRRSEYILEAFWRVQLTPGIQFTPDVQLWLDPSQRPGHDTQGVFSMRATFDF
ncbi:MAG: carbohydrate porin [Rubripirellula sp.]